MADLMRELANMVCGAWLTRAASHQIFSLRTRPVEMSVAGAPMDDETWITLAINDRPFAVAVRAESPRPSAEGCRSEK